MKQLMIFTTAIFLLTCTFSIKAQEFKQDIGSAKLISINQVVGQIIISEHTGNEITVNAEGYVSKKHPEKAKGLTQINSNGVDNTNIGLNMSQKGKALEFISVEANSKPVTYHFHVPKGISVKIDNSKTFHSFGFHYSSLEVDELGNKIDIIADEAVHQNGDLVFIGDGDNFFEKKEKPEKGKKPRKIADGVIVNSFSGELEIKTMSDGINLKNVTGPLTINSMSGPININFSSVNQSAPITITSYSGEIDITMPSSSKANLKLSSMNGDIYTDFDIKFKQEKEHSGLTYIGGGSNINGTINGGGVDIMLKALSDNIYLRKK